MMDGFKINIPRPVPDTGENEKYIAFIEPLRKDGKVFVSGAHFFNLAQFAAGSQPSWSPGFRYEFVFPEEQDATAFKLVFGGTVVK